MYICTFFGVFVGVYLVCERFGQPFFSVLFLWVAELSRLNNHLALFSKWELAMFGIKRIRRILN